MIIKCLRIVAVFLLVFTFGCNSKRNNYKNQMEWSAFYWNGDSINGRWFDKLALKVPVKLQGIKKEFLAQLDLGAPHSIIYENTTRSFISKNKSSFINLDTIDKGYSINGKKLVFLKNIDINVGNHSVESKELGLLTNYGINYSIEELESTNNLSIGSIGVNAFENKVLIIDFPKQQFTVKDSLNSNFEKQVDWVNLKIENGRIKMPLIVNNKEEWFMFDTGASWFPIMTNMSLWKEWRDKNSKVDTMKTSSWGEEYNVLGSQMRTPFKLGNTELLGMIYENPKQWNTDMLKKEGVLGIIGNAFFFKNTIVIDFKNERFGIIN